MVCHLLVLASIIELYHLLYPAPTFYEKKLVRGILEQMKKILLFVFIFLFGGATYAFLNPFLMSFLQKETPKEKEPPSQNIVPTTSEPVPVVVETKEEEKKPVVIDEDGSVHDGPFAIRDADGKDTTTTAEIIRSAEETLLQFKNVSFKHGSDAHIYFATDKKATKYLSLGQADLNAGVLIYGMPLDADLSAYEYILIYDTYDNTVEYFAEIE